MRLWTHGRVGGARFVELCFVNFCIFPILRSMEWPAPDYHKSLVFMNETGQRVSQVPLVTEI